MMTLEKLLEKTDNGTLLDIQQELISGIVPTTGYAHNFCRKVNFMIDNGQLRINVMSHRKVYLPTLTKYVNQELARRYANILKGLVDPATLVAKEDTCKQLALDLVSM